MARKGTIKNMGKVQREVSAAWKARKDAKAATTPDDKTPPTREEANRLAERAAVAVFGPAVLNPAPDAAPKPADKRGKAAKAPAPTAAKKAKSAKPATERKAAREAKPKPAKRVSALDAAAQVLSEAPEPMGVNALVEQMAKRGLWSSPGGKTPGATLNAAIIREIASKAEASRFRKVDRGLFAANKHARAVAA